MDSVANMLTTLANAQSVGKERVAVPYSSFKEAFSQFLQSKGVVAKVRVQEGAAAKLIITLKYDQGEPVIRGVRRLSRPGRRRYVGRHQLPFRGGKPGFFVLSTSEGLMDADVARKKSLGGELICEIDV